MCGDCSPSSVSVLTSQTPCTASNATDGSDACGLGPRRGRVRRVPGRKLRCHVLPASVDTAVPMFEAAPSARRPTWNTATTVDPDGGAVRLDGRLVLAVVVRVRVDREPARHDLAVRGDAIGSHRR